MSDKRVDRLRRDGRIDRQHDRRGAGERDRVEVLFRIVRQGAIERRIDDEGRRRGQDRVAIGRSPGRLSRANIAAGAADILDIELLSKTVRQFLRDNAGNDVADAAGRKWDDATDRPHGIRLG
ncbi:MAG: hypothetical protein WDN48_14955 [Pseudolabrys sp.]